MKIRGYLAVDLKGEAAITILGRKLKLTSRGLEREADGSIL